MTRTRGGRRHRDQRGATLVLVLILVTTVAAGLGVTLSLTDTSERTTVGMHQQASTAYAADGAAQAAVQQLVNDSFNNTATEVLSNFYPAVNGAPAASAAVRCTPDPANNPGGGGANSSPGSA